MKSKGLKSILIICLAAFTFHLSAQQAAVTMNTYKIIIIDKFSVPQLKRQQTIRILLPRNYAFSNKKYPVLYMLDGQNLFNGNIGSKDKWEVDSTVNTFPLSRQCIIVGIDNDKYRMTEYNPYNSTYGSGEGIAYVKFFVETLKPYIDSNYRTKTEARYNAIAGSSMGGLLAMYAGLTYPHTFGNAGIFSPAFWLAPQIYTEVNAQQINKRSGFYLTCGDLEGNELEFVIKMDTVLRAKGLSSKKAPSPVINIGEKHNEIQWRKAFPAFYRWLTEQY